MTCRVLHNDEVYNCTKRFYSWTDFGKRCCKMRNQKTEASRVACVPTDDEAMAEPHPNVLKHASTISPVASSTLIWSFITSPQAGAPTRPVPTEGSFLSKDPTLRGWLQCSTTCKDSNRTQAAISTRSCTMPQSYSFCELRYKQTMCRAVDAHLKNRSKSDALKFVNRGK